MDTRAGNGAPRRPVAGGRVLAVQVAGRGGVPADAVSAVALTLTAAGATAGGHVSVYADGQATPLASNLTFSAGRTVANLVISRLGPTGRIDLAVSGHGTTALIADITGYYTAGDPVPGGFAALDPARVLDTRAGVGAPRRPVAGGRVLAVQVAGRGGVPADAVSAVALTLTAAGATAGGHVSVYADGQATPLASNLTFSAGRTVANLVISRLGPTGRIDLAVSGHGTTALIADITGYYTAGDPVAGGFAALDPARVLDTRAGVGAPRRPVAGGRVLAVQVAGRGGVPADAVSAVALTLTAAGATAGGHVSVYADGQATPLASNLTFSAGRTVANLVISKLGPTGRIDLAVSGHGTTALIADITGYFLEPRNQLAWSDPTLVEPYHGGIISVSCVSASFCMAVDGRGNAMTFDGTDWTVPRPVGNETGELEAVSCVSATWCVAAGRDGEALLWDGSQWSPTGTTGVSSFSTLSCASTTFCAAGTLIEGSGLVFNGQSWTVTASVSHGNMTSISCPEPTFCAFTQTADAVGEYVNGSWSHFSYPPGAAEHISCATTTFCLAANGDSVFRFNGSHTSAPHAIDPGGQIDSISCPTTTFCVAADQTGHTLTFDGHGWSTLTPLTDPTGFYPAIFGLSCASAEFCEAVAVDGAENRYQAGQWQANAVIDGISPTATSLSCPAAGFCVAGDTAGQVITEHGTEWSLPQTVDPGQSIETISCASATFCVAVDTDSNALTFNGSSWTTPVAVTSKALYSVSCPTTTFCVAVGDLGTWATFDGQRWHVSPTRIARRPQISVSCPTPTFCAEVDHARARTYNGRTGPGSAQIAPAFHKQLDTVSCVSAWFCMAAGPDGGSYEFDGTGWSLHLTAEPHLGAQYVSCASNVFCLMPGGPAAGSAEFDGTKWSPAPAVPGWTDHYYPAAVSCEADTCTVLGETNNAATTS